MFEWKIEDMALLNDKDGIFLGSEKIYTCESTVSREDKIAFVDSLQDGKLSYLLYLIEKFDKEKDDMPKNQWGNVKTVSLKAWIKRNDTKYGRPILDDFYHYGRYCILGKEGWITSGVHLSDGYSDLVNELFHRQLKVCEKEEYKYFLEHDEYSILKEKFRNKQYSTTFGVRIADCSDGKLYVYKDENGFYNSESREITIDELKYLLSKYEELDKLVEKITNETNIVF